MTPVRSPAAVRTVLFYRHYVGFRGGHMKVFDYFEHVRSSARYDARVRFTPASIWDPSNPWWQLPDTVIAAGETLNPDVLFLAGGDWERLDADGGPPPGVPIVNLIQGLFHARRRHPLNRHVSRRAIRVCVSEQVQAELEMDKATEGPILTVPIGFDRSELPAVRPFDERDIDCVVLAVKNAPLGQRVARRLTRHGHSVALIEQRVPRAELLDMIGRSRVTAHLPERREGAYLPALESMAVESIVVCPDCVGNRGFCRDGETCFVPKATERSISNAVRSALAATPQELAPLLASARAQSLERTLTQERERFLAVLDRVDELWQSG